MLCPSCAREVPDGASFCRHCGWRLASVESGRTEVRPPEAGARALNAASSAAAQPLEPPGVEPALATPAAEQPSGAPYAPSVTPPPRRGGRGLLIALIVAVLVLLFLGVAAGAMLMVARSDRSDQSPSETAIPATMPPESPPTSPADTQPPSASTTDATSPGDDYSGGEWVEMDQAGPPGAVYLVAVSDEAAAFATEDSIFALEFAGGRLQQIPTEMEASGMPDIDGPQLVWWEGTYDQEVEEWTDEGIFAYRLPSGPRIQLAGKEGAPGFPLVTAGFVTWTEARPSTFSPEEVWEFPIRGTRIGADGRPVGPTELLVPAPTAFIQGDSIWNYDLSPAYLAWENARDTAAADAGSYLRDLRSGEDTYLGPDSWRPSVAGSNVAYWGEGGLYLRDLATGEVRLLDSEGDWPALADSYVAYLRPTEGTGWEIVTLGLTDGSEQIVGVQSTPPWFGSHIAVAPHHLAFVDDENQAHVFERRR